MPEAPIANPEPQSIRRVLQWIPRKARLAVCFGVVVLIPLAIYSYLANGNGDLNVICRHNLQSAALTVTIDGELAFQDQVSGTVKKRFGFLDKKVEGTLSKSLSIPLGKHTVRVNLKSSPDRFDQTRQIAVNLVAGKESTVLITSQRSDLTLTYQGAPLVPDKDGNPSSSGSTESILMTVMGSIVSAAIGFLVQEFLRTRKAAYLHGQNSKPAQ